MRAGGLERTRERLDRARHAPGYVYTSPEVLRLECERVFARDWLFVGRAEEFEKPGDYRAFWVLDEPMVVARDREGRLNAFANVCVHRGVEVAYGEGNADSFSCPYHAWRYDLNGRLITAPLMRTTDTFDPKRCRMKPVRLAEWAGIVRPHGPGAAVLHRRQARCCIDPTSDRRGAVGLLMARFLRDLDQASTEPRAKMPEICSPNRVSRQKLATGAQPPRSA